MFQYRFMLFDPSSTFESIWTNVQFLRSIVGDGSMAATFSRMLPYDGTPSKTSWNGPSDSEVTSATPIMIFSIRVSAGTSRRPLGDKVVPEPATAVSPVSC
jgi:hypothetical protein